ncbi:uncharacterized protein SRS1_12149 [Sporisorium reilianum f. sp. reilianum]|uniref:Uncharacterized protein n=1 Tax=Sporisorium reilianum f. sp. reilianum TaxID=72559 RepID=A0A2N8U9F0_9BASI|nr:uncharacterized protein SRS1_12149 [Sporisorium reilianum f. sp. reilianum]
MLLPPYLQRWLLLNTIRILTITSCILVTASTIRTLVHNFQHYPAPLPSTSTAYYPSTDIPTSFLGVFWSTLHHISLTLVLLTVVLSELSLPVPLLHRLFKNTLPFLGPNWGLGFLGVLLVLVAADGLSRAGTGAFAQASGWTLAVMGVINVGAGVVWRAKAKVVRSPMAWKREVAEKMERLAEAKATAERVVDALPLPTTTTTKEKLGGEGGRLKEMLEKAAKAVSTKMEDRHQKPEQDLEAPAPTMAIFAPPLPSAIVSSRTVPPPPAPPAPPSTAASPKKPTPLALPARTATPAHSRTSTSSSSSVYTLDVPNTNPTLKTVRFHPTLHHPSPIPSLTASPFPAPTEVNTGGSKFLLPPSPSPRSVVDGERSPSVLASLKAAMLEAQAKASAQPSKKSLYLGSTRWRAEYGLASPGHDEKEEEKKKPAADRPYNFL